MQSRCCRTTESYPTYTQRARGCRAMPTDSAETSTGLHASFSLPTLNSLPCRRRAHVDVSICIAEIIYFAQQLRGPVARACPQCRCARAAESRGVIGLRNRRELQFGFSLCFARGSCFFFLLCRRRGRFGGALYAM